ncbi:hypothetical protein BsWGS_03542 [Bradybaena similaris]
MESNSLWFDQKVGTVYYDIVNIREMDKPLVETFIFNKISQVDIEFKLEFDRNPTLRYSLCLSTQEKAFMELRKEKTLEEMRKLLGVEDGPLDIDEVPTIAVMGSGGGFRAMTGYSGVFKALSESGVLDCSMYACGLSGSSWLLSTLYSHPKWPNLDMNEFLDELKHNIDKSLLRFLNASTMYSYLRFMIQKRKDGQPVSFTDIFGRMVGETLLKGRMETTLTDQREKIKDGAIPMPLYTCVHVKKDVPARSFQEWVEFSPYEIGLPKYGTFMDSELFGSKFFMGKLVKQYKEQPLHFLQGIWGSAFCILFKRLLEDNRRIDPVEMVRQEMGKQLDEAGQESSSDCSDDEIDDSTDSIDGEDGSIQIAANGQHPSYDEKAEVYPPNDNASQDSFHMDNTDNSKVTINDASVEILGSKAGEKKSKIQSQDYHVGIEDSEQDYHNDTEENEQDDSAYEGEEDGEDEDYDDDEETEIRKIHSQAIKKRGSVEMKRARQTKQSSKDSASPDNDLTQESIEVPQLPASQKNHVSTSEPACEPKKSVNWGTCPTLGKTGDDVDCKKKRQAFNSATSVRKSRSGSKSYWNQLLKKIFEGNSWELLSTRRGRAAVIHNFMRGLSLQQTYPLSPFTPVDKRVKDGDLFDGNFEMHSTSVKHIYMVDAGLTFNSPYPLVLRPQREVDIILSFDFSARDSDNAQPFKELLLAEKWARLNRLPFPPIDTSVFEREGMKELYIFRHPTDPHCPVVLHFVLVNKTFRYYKKPGIPRETKEEFKFADFDIFDDPKAPYSTFNFTYAHKNFEQLSQLMEFNTLLHIDDIKEVIKDVIKKKREGPPRVPIQSKDIKLLHMKSVQERRKLRRFISRMESRKSSYTGTSPSTPFLTPTLNCDTNTNPFFPRLQQEVLLSPSNDIIASPTPSDRLADSFSRSARGKRHLHPNDIISESEEMNYTESTENDVTGQFSVSPNSSSFQNIFNNSTEKSDQIRHLRQTSSLNKTITNMHTLQPADVCGGPEEHMSVTECDLQFCPNRHTSSASKRELKDTDFTDQSSIDSSLVTCSTFQNVARSQLASGVKCPDTSKYYKTQSDSSGYGGSGAEVSLDGTTKVHASQTGTPGTGTFSIDSTGSGYSAKYTPGGKLNNHTPANPFFKKFINMTSSRSSLSPSASDSSQSLNSPEDIRSSKQVGRLNLRSPRLSPLVVSSNNKPQSPPEVQRLPSSATLEIFSLAPEAFKSDGTPVFDSQQAKMYYEGAKSKRKFFRRQSTVSSMNSISLDENKPSSCEKPNEDPRGHSGDGHKSSSKKTIMHSSTDSSDIFQTCDDNRLQSVTSDLAELASRQKQQTKQSLHDSTGDLDFSDLSQFTGVSDADIQLVNQSASFAQDEQPISEAESVIMNVWYDAEDNTI